jgi:hypothetical protein
VTHPKGSIVYTPQGQFNFNRSYVSEVLLHLESHLSYTVSGNEFTFLYSPAPTYRAFLKFRDEFWDWSSNTYSLDFVVEWNYQINFPGDTETTFFLGVAWNYDVTTHKFAIDITTVLPSLHSHYDLPPPTQVTWWGHP